MNSTLYVGDVHFKYKDKEECERLLIFIEETTFKNEVKEIVFLGDLNDTFGFLRVENETFWSKWFSKLCQNLRVIVVCGNHDKKNQGNDDDLESTLDIYNRMGIERLWIVKTPVNLGCFGYVPYIHDKERFVNSCNKLVDSGAKVIVCHAEPDGATYDNGMPIPFGFKPDDVKCDLIISGHIHTKSFYGKIRLVGSPRWMTASDANKEKGIWLVTHDDKTGAIVEEQFLDTSHVCTPIYAYQYKEGEDAPIIPEGSRASVELIGSSEWVLKQKANLKNKASISCKITDKARVFNRKTGNNLEHFVSNIFEISKTVDKTKVLNFMKENNIL